VEKDLKIWMWVFSDAGGEEQERRGEEREQGKAGGPASL
jgi:hypothetical protein